MCIAACVLGCKNPSATVASKDAGSASKAAPNDAWTQASGSLADDPFLRARACDPEPTRLPTALGGLEKELADAFDHNKLRPALSKIDPSKVSVELSDSLKDAKSAMERAESTLGAATDDVVFSAASCGQFEDSLQELARVFRKHDDASADALVLLVRCWWHTADARSRLSALDAEMNRLSSRRAVLHSANPIDPRVHAVDALQDKYVVFRAALSKIERETHAYESAWRDLATVLDKAAARSGMKRIDRSRLSATLAAMPRIETVVHQLDWAKQQPPAIQERDRYTGAWGMCRNVAYSYSPSDISARSENEIANLEEVWRARASVLRAVLDQALSVPGTDF